MTTEKSNRQFATLDEAIANMEDDWLLCRAFGHSWRPIRASREANWGVLISLQCRSCKTKRDDTIDKLGAVSTRTYTHPPGYLLTGYDNRPSRAEWRLNVGQFLIAKGGS